MTTQAGITTIVVGCCRACGAAAITYRGLCADHAYTPTFDHRYLLAQVAAEQQIHEPPDDADDGEGEQR